MLHYYIILKALISILLIAVIGQNLDAQKRWINNKAAPIESIDHIILPTLNNEKLRNQYKFYSNHSRVPHTFAEALTTDIKSLSNGTWESSINDHLIWRQRITSRQAYSINLGFTDFYLPASAVLFISNIDRSYVIGPITQEDNDLHQEWWSPVIPGEGVILELQIAPEEVPDLRLHLTKVNHDFSGLGAVISGSCNLDVICGLEDGYGIIDRYRHLINGLGMMMIGGRLQCTGSLINNTRRDCTPYVLTAEHCGITEANAATVVIYWNFQNSQCRAPNSVESGNDGDGSQLQFNSGSSLVAKYDQSDFSLVELDDAVDPISNPYFLGWNNDTEAVDTAFTIHHPLGGEKRISFDFDTITFNVDRNFVQVVDWDLGTTESGSSGAPLFNTSGHVVGHLSGGDAACGNDLEDDFGMIKRSWEGGGTPETRLKDWLDPIGSGITFLDGRFCTDVAVLDVDEVSICTNQSSIGIVVLTATAGYEDSASITVTEADNGLEVSTSIPTLNMDQMVDISIEVTDAFVGTSGFITLVIENDLGPSEFNLEVNVFRDIPEIVNLIEPIDGISGLDFDISFSWSDDSPTYQLEVSEFADFSRDIRMIVVDKNNAKLSDFKATTTYYWRVKALNICGEGDYSDIRSFVTGTIICQTFIPEDTPLLIGLDPVNVSSTIQVNGTGTISDVNILNVTGTHTWISDLTFVLTSPTGTQVTLVETPCLDEDDFLVSFDDETDNVNLDCPLTSGRTFKPVESLSVFMGEEPSGDWVLTVEDGVGDDGGSFDDWTLELCLNQTDVKRFDANPSILNICDKVPDNIGINVVLQGVWDSPTNPVISTGSGIALAATISPNPIGTAKQITITFLDPSALHSQNSLTISFDVDGEKITLDMPVTHITSVQNPVLNTPIDLAEDIALSPTLGWTTGLTNGGIHRITLSKEKDFSTLILDELTSEDTLRVSVLLEELTRYYWQVTAEGPCADSTSTVFSFITDKKTATIDQRLRSIKIYPSPVNDILTINLGDQFFQGQIKYQFLSLTGQVIKQGQMEQVMKEISMADIATGFYLINFISDRGIFARKIVVNR